MKLKKYYILVASLIILSSCSSDWLDEYPSNGVDEEKAITNSTELGSALTGMYNALKGRTSSFMDYYGALMFIYGEVRGEDVQANMTGSGRATFYYTMEYTTVNNFTRSTSIWQSPYLTLGRANRIIAAAESGALTDASSEAAVIAQYLNEAKVMRALVHFDLTRIYGKPYLQSGGPDSYGAALQTSVLRPKDGLIRSTVSECYDQIITDLTEAIASNALPVTKTQGYINKWVAEALLARVYLTKGDYTNAIAMAQDVINNSPYTLWTRDQYVNAWSKTDGNHTNEMIMELSITSTQDWTDRNGIAYLYWENGYRDLFITKAFSDSLTSDASDIRNNVVLAPTTQTYINRFGTNKVFVNKMPASTNNDVRYSNVPLIRLSEMYLTVAEAAFDNGDLSTAAQYLNSIISNRTTDATKQVTASNITAQRIYMERRKELFGEGHRYFDALRRGETITRYTSSADQDWHGTLNVEAQSYNTWTFRKQLPLIPAAEIGANPRLQQNPTY